MSDAITASTVSHKTLKNGDIRLEVQIDPGFAKDFFTSRMTGPGIGIALAVLTPEAAKKQLQDEMIDSAEEKPGKVRGQKRWNELRPQQRAGIMCKERLFWEFITNEYSQPISGEQSATQWLRDMLQISSRKQLEINGAACELLDEIDDEYRGWLKSQQYEGLPEAS